MSSRLLETESLYLLLTYYGTFVAWDIQTRQFCHRPFLSIDGSLQYSFVAVEEDALRAVTIENGSIATSSDDLLIEAGELEIERSSDDLLLGIKHNNLFFCADGAGTFKADREHRSNWETFRPLSETDLHDLEGFFSDSWIAVPSGQLLKTVRYSFRQAFCVALGEYELDLSKEVPALPTRDRRSALEIVSRYNDWKIGRFRRFKPLIFYVCLGEQTAFDMLHISMTSLCTIGRYQGDILIFSDRSKEELRSSIPADAYQRCYVEETVGLDILDYSRLRYDLFKWKPSYNYQPILYVDTDVLFDAPVEPILIKIAMSDVISAQRERTHYLATMMSVGSSLWAADHFPVAGQEGFNTGIIGIPNIDSTVTVLSAISETITLLASKYGRNPFGWYDQPIANYVTFKLTKPDLNLLDNHIRFGGKASLHGGIQPSGLIHMWGAKDKLKELKEMLSILAGDMGDEIVQWIIYPRSNN